MTGTWSCRGAYLEIAPDRILTGIRPSGLIGAPPAALLATPEPEQVVWRPMVLSPTNLLHLCAPVRLVRTEREFRLATGCGQSELAVSEPGVWLVSRSSRALSVMCSAIARESLAPAAQGRGAPGEKRGLGARRCNHRKPSPSQARCGRKIRFFSSSTQKILGVSRPIGGATLTTLFSASIHAPLQQRNRLRADGCVLITRCNPLRSV